MAIEYVDVNDHFRRISISGRLDIQGTDEIATKFAALSAAADRRVVLDLMGVTFLASIGIRSIVMNAKALQQRGGKMVLLVGDNQAIIKTLESTGMDTIFPMFADATEADKAALA
jgi:anti-anti-sigma factor